MQAGCGLLQRCRRNSLLSLRHHLDLLWSSAEARHADGGLPFVYIAVRTVQRGFAAQPLPVAESSEAGEAAHQVQQQQVPQQQVQVANAHASQNLIQLLDRGISKAYEPLFLGEAERGRSRISAHILAQFAPLRLLLDQHQQHPDHEEAQRMLGKWEQQLRLEWDTMSRLLEKYKQGRRRVMQIGKGDKLSGANRYLDHWVPGIQAAIEQEIAQFNDRKGDSISRQVVPYLKLLPPREAASIAVNVMMSLMLSEEKDGATKASMVAMKIGRAMNNAVTSAILKNMVVQESKRQKAVMRVKRQAWKLAKGLEAGGTEDWKVQLGYIIDKWQARCSFLDISPARAEAALLGDLEQELRLQTRARADKAWAAERDSLARKLQEMLSADEQELEAWSEHDWFKTDPAWEECLVSGKAALAEVEAQAAGTARRGKGHYRPQSRPMQLEALRRVQDAVNEDLRNANWPSIRLAAVGATLLKYIIDLAKVEVPMVDSIGRTVPGRTSMVPAFEQRLQRSWDNRAKAWWKMTGIIAMHSNVFDRLLNAGFEFQDVGFSQWLPMVVPPLPWSNIFSGGYLSQRAAIMRLRGPKRHLKRLKDAHARGELQQVYDALNVLGSLPWTINRDIFDLMLKLYHVKGGGIAGLPVHSTVAQVLPEPPPVPWRFRTDAANGQLTAAVMPATAGEIRIQKRKVAQARKQNREAYSERCSMNYKLAVAEMMVDEPAIYFPHSMDFRGRAYPMHPHLNHLGDDVSRGLLQFADAKPLGPNGLLWLKVSIANLYGRGADKLPMAGPGETRESFADEHQDDIFDSAQDPLGERGGRRWWLTSEEPWQLLAACIELRAALLSGNPENFMSRLPVHQDGSCNGLQHYAALARDDAGGRSVNLQPADRPQDVYSDIAHRVRIRIASDAKKDHPQAQALLSLINRKLVKQTVMTSVYGVTFVGAREQMTARLKARLGEGDYFKLSSYGAKVTLESLHAGFKNAKDVMRWLALMARAVARTGLPVTWTTPLGLPVVQPYVKMPVTRVKTPLQRINVADEERMNSEGSEISKSRQRSAFPPNYIHSIDSSHMMMTALACNRAGLVFAGVHDSFWTHAGTVDTMNALLRDTFVALHSQPLLEQLEHELRSDPANANVPEAEWPAMPKLGDLNLEHVRDAKYFFS